MRREDWAEQAAWYWRRYERFHGAAVRATGEQFCAKHRHFGEVLSCCEWVIPAAVYEEALYKNYLWAARQAQLRPIVERIQAKVLDKRRQGEYVYGGYYAE